MNKQTQQQKILDFVRDRWFTIGELNKQFAFEINSCSKRLSEICQFYNVEKERVETDDSWCYRYRVLGRKEVA